MWRGELKTTHMSLPHLLSFSLQKPPEVSGGSFTRTLFDRLHFLRSREYLQVWMTKKEADKKGSSSTHTWGTSLTDRTVTTYRPLIALCYNWISDNIKLLRTTTPGSSLHYDCVKKKKNNADFLSIRENCKRMFSTGSYRERTGGPAHRTGTTQTWQLMRGPCATSYQCIYHDGELALDINVKTILSLSLSLSLSLRDNINVSGYLFIGVTLYTMDG